MGAVGLYQRGYLQLALFDAVCVTTRTVLKCVCVIFCLVGLFGFELLLIFVIA